VGAKFADWCSAVTAVAHTEAPGQVVKRGLDVEVKGKDGWTPLMVRCAVYRGFRPSSAGRPRKVAERESCASQFAQRRLSGLLRAACQDGRAWQPGAASVSRKALLWSYGR
jgi:hypothetical protein